MSVCHFLNMPFLFKPLRISRVHTIYFDHINPLLPRSPFILTLCLLPQPLLGCKVSCKQYNCSLWCALRHSCISYGLFREETEAGLAPRRMSLVHWALTFAESFDFLQAEASGLNPVTRYRWLKGLLCILKWLQDSPCIPSIILLAISIWIHRTRARK